MKETIAGLEAYRRAMLPSKTEGAEEFKKLKTEIGEK